MRRRLISTIGAMMGLAVLAGCQTGSQAVQAPARPTGIEGRWGDTSGVAVSTLRGGSFTSTATDTGSVLAEGSYRSVGPGQIAIEYTSRLRGERIAANCNQVAVDRLSCASSSGNRFDLNRQI